MRKTIRTKLGFIIGVLLCLFIILGLITYNQIQTIHKQIQEVIDVERPISTVAYEMNINLLRIGFDLLWYLEQTDQTHLDRINSNREQFKKLQQIYSTLAATDKGKSLGDETKQFFIQFEEHVEHLVKIHDEQTQRLHVYHEKMKLIAELLDEHTQTVVTTENVHNYAKFEATMEMEINIHEMRAEMGKFLETPDKNDLNNLQNSQNDFAQYFEVYQSYSLSPEETRELQKLRRFFDEIVVLSTDIINLKKQCATILKEFVQLRRSLGNNILYEGIIQGIAQKGMTQTENDALSAVETTNRLILLLLSASLIFGGVFGAIFSRNLTAPLKQVAHAGARISQGELSGNLNITSNDEIGLLANSFRNIETYLREVSEVAESISEGNLSVEVEPKSRHDTLNTSLKKMIVYLQEVSTVTEKISNKDLHVNVRPRSEHDALNHSLQRMIRNLQLMHKENEQQNWLQNGLNQLNNELLGEPSLLEVCNKAIRFVSRYVNAGYGGLYVYSPEEEAAKMYSSFAFIERDTLSNVYKLGEGVVGQVALEKNPILLKNITRKDRLIKTGTTSQPPRNTYTYPLLYNLDLYGIIELASFDPFDEAKQHFLNETNRVIATVIFSTKQREKVQELLQVSQQATQNAKHAAREAEQAKEGAQRKADELQKANLQLEEQQQRLQQQSEEMQQVNAHLKEQQQRLQQQSEELRQQNESLNLTRQELDKRARELELASKYKSEFLANMSHELRTPLNSIILLSKMLGRNDKGNLDKKDIKQATVIHQAGEELLRLINDILDLSKIEAGKVTMNITEFSTQTLLTTFKDLFHSIAEEKDLEFIVRDTLKATLKTDQDKLSQVIRNLLSNAFKFTRQGSVLLQMSVHPDSKDNFQITVTDTGIGIPQNKQTTVFEAFQQADGSMSREFGGTGLGLSIVREYVRLLQGTIELESEEGQGTIFTVTLPIFFNETSLDSESLQPPSASVSKIKKRIKETTSMAAVSDIEDDRDIIQPVDKIILLIEDNADVAQATMDIIREKGFKVLVALDGQTGLSLTKQFRPTGILLDLVLPDINGMEVLRELKSTRELRHIPVHIVSSKERDNTFQNAGAIGYYQKPVNDIDIQHALENIISVSEKYPKQLLIVEDDETQREAIQELLGDSHELQITGVSSQHDAITEIKKGDYDAAIIDLGLKDGDGYEICKYIREQHIALPVIIYTGKDLTEEQERELRKYTESIIIKTARSYERLSDEVSLFLHKMYHGEEKPERHPSIPHSLKPTGNLKGKKILIVDDDVKNVFVLASALENDGATVIDAPNGQEALNILHQLEKVDLVLMDVMMPVMDGYTAIQHIRKDKNLQHLPIIALTAKALKDDRQKCIQAGADDYLAKPVDYDGLIRLVKAWIEKG